MLYIADLDTPCVLVDLDVLKANIEEMATLSMQAGKRFRPHVKTHKCIEIATMQHDAGADGITVAKASEAEVFAAAGFSDIFIANLIVGQPKLDHIVRLAETCRLTVGLDSVAVAEPIARAAEARGVVIQALIEVDTGHGRTGVRTVEEAVRIATLLRTYGHVSLQGVYTHEGHAYRASREQLPELCRNVVRNLSAMREAAERAYGEPLLAVSVGSTPSTQAMSTIAEVTELRPGNYVFRDATQVRLGSPVERCALTVLTTVIARPSSTEAVLDAGSKALSGDGDCLCGHGFALGHPEARVDWCSEEHGHLHLGTSNWRPALGQKIRIVPAHACTCVNMHSWLWIVRGDEVLARWPVSARGRLL